MLCNHCKALVIDWSATTQALVSHTVNAAANHSYQLVTWNTFTEEDYIFWVDSQARTISRIKRDLTDQETLVDSGIYGVEGLAVDWIAGMASPISVLS